MNLRIVFAVCIICLYSVGSPAKVWRGIVPLRSSRSDVERMIGTPKSKGKFVSSYEFTDELVDVYYSSGPPCGRALTNEWKVQSDVVVSVRILPKKETNFDDLVKDATKFKKTTDPIETTLAYYSNEDEGVRYTVRRDARTLVQDIIAIDYFPDHSQFYLKCSIAKSTPISCDLALFDKFNNLKASRKKATLDNFAIQLQKEKPLNGLVLVYAPTSKRAAMAAKEVRSYLVRVRGIEPHRLTIKAFKQGSEFLVELYLVPSDRGIR